MDEDNVRITVQAYGKKIELTFPHMCDIYEYSNVFKTILTWLTFSPVVTKEILRGQDEDFNEED